MPASIPEIGTEAVWFGTVDQGLLTAPSLSLPFDDPILIFGLAMVVFLVAPLVLERYRLPGIVGIILVGAAIGPNGFHLLERDATIQLLGEVGLVYLMFVAGLEIDINQFVEYKDRSAVFGTLSFVIPQVIGTVIGVYVLDFSWAGALLFAAVFSSHTLLAYPVVNQLGIADNEAITVTIGGTIITDTLALLVLAIVIASVGGDLTPLFWVQLGVGLTLFFLGVWFVVPRIGRWFFRAQTEESYFEFLFVMATLFTCAFLAELVGVEHIIGAFLAGLALNRLVLKTGPLMNRIEFVGNALFIPFFLLSVGMLVDVWVLTEGFETIGIAISLIGMVFATKYVAAWVMGAVYGYNSDERIGIFGLSVGQAAAALAIVQIGFDAGIPGFDRHMINAVVMMILVVSLLSPALVERGGRALVKAREQAAYEPGAAQQRILVPVSRRSQYKESLLDLAFTVRDDRFVEPIHAVSVVRPERTTRIEAAVARAASVLDDMAAYASGADVPVETHTAVNHNVASGIVRTAVENRISTLVIGWDGARSREQSMFGHVIDQVLALTSQLTLVSRVRMPLNTTERIVLVLPAAIRHNDGFPEAIHTVKLLARETGAPVYGLSIDADNEYERLLSGIDPKVPSNVTQTGDWEAVHATISEMLEPNDLVVCMSARRDAIGWHPELQTLPSRISTVTDGNFVVVYPATAEVPDDRQFLGFP